MEIVRIADAWSAENIMLKIQMIFTELRCLIPIEFGTYLRNRK